VKTFVIGDIHGAYKAFLQCLRLSQFDRKHDRLICLGDICDRGEQVKESIDELLTISHCVCILGNHDAWGLNWALHGNAPIEWLEQGGAATVKSYQGKNMPQEHIQFLTQAHLYFVDQNRLFVHAGFDPERPLEETPKDIFLWDRNLIKGAQLLQAINPEHQFGIYKEVYLGHTPTTNFGKSQPQQFCNIWAMDTGAGWGNKLTIMDIESKQFWQAV